MLLGEAPPTGATRLFMLRTELKRLFMLLEFAVTVMGLCDHGAAGLSLATLEPGVCLITAEAGPGCSTCGRCLTGALTLEPCMQTGGACILDSAGLVLNRSPHYHGSK
jgi:hypothetical protein